MDERTVLAQSVEDVLRWLGGMTHSFADGEWIFRGHADASWELLPTALRDNGKAVRQLVPTVPAHATREEAEEEVVGAFLRILRETGQPAPADDPRLWTTDFQRMILMKQVKWDPPDIWPPDEMLPAVALAQHSGLPTCLLDWSASAHVAAYFATSGGTARARAGLEGEAMVWALGASAATGFYAHPDWSIARVRIPRQGNARLFAQRGVFTVVRRGRSGLASSPKELTMPLEKLLQVDALRGLRIPWALCSKLLEILHESYQCSSAYLFPDPAGAAQHLVEFAPFPFRYL